MSIYQLILCSLLLVGLVNCQRGFVIKIENLSAGAIVPTPFSDVVWALHPPGVNPLFRPGTYSTQGLQSLAEDGLGNQLYTEALLALNNVSSNAGLIKGPIPLGGSIEFGITASPGQAFSFVTMIVESNNDFMAPTSAGVPLFDSNDNPSSGQFQTFIYDAGTEKSEPLGNGVNQPLEQPTTAVGQVINIPVAQQVLKGTNYSNPVALLRFTITPATLFTFRLTNVGSGTPFSPPVWAVSTARETLFTAGQVASPGIQALAENGNPSILEAQLLSQLGKTVLFTGVGSSGAIPPGSFAEFTVPAILGSTFHIASMYGWSNDRFFATPAAGVSLFNSSGPISTPAAPWIWLWDAGTAMSEPPGQGPNQAANRHGQPRNPAVWPDASSVVKEAYNGDDDSFVYQPVTDFQLSISPVTDAPGFLGSNPNQNLYVNFQFKNMFKLNS